MKDPCEILLFLSLLRGLHPDLERQCLQGSCFKLYLLLEHCYPDAVPYYDSDHVITKLGDRYYDIRGEVLPGANHLPMKDDSSVFNRAYIWGKHDH